MAQKVQTLLVDDLDGSEANSTISFGLDGTDYEIDLNAAHAAELRAALAEYVGAGRKVGSAQRRSTRSGARRTANGQPTRPRSGTGRKARVLRSATAAAFPPS